MFIVTILNIVKAEYISVISVNAVHIQSLSLIEYSVFKSVNFAIKLTATRNRIVAISIIIVFTKSVTLLLVMPLKELYGLF